MNTKLMRKTDAGAATNVLQIADGSLIVGVIPFAWLTFPLFVAGKTC